VPARRSSLGECPQFIEALERLPAGKIGDHFSRRPKPRHARDVALATFDAEKREHYKAGLRQTEVLRAKLFPGSANVEGLSREQRQELLRGLEASEFFEVLRTHVVLGYLADPQYGGNRQKAGWKYINFDDRMVFEPPFGYYDAHHDGEAK